MRTRRSVNTVKRTRPAVTMAPACATGLYCSTSTPCFAAALAVASPAAAAAAKGPPKPCTLLTTIAATSRATDINRDTRVMMAADDKTKGQITGGFGCNRGCERGRRCTVIIVSMCEWCHWSTTSEPAEKKVVSTKPPKMRDHQDVWRGQCETVTCSCAGYVRRKSGPSQHRCKQCHHSAAMHSARDLRHAHQVATRVFKEMPSPSKPQARFADKVTIHNLKPSALLGAFGKSGGGGAGGVPGSATTTTAATKSRPRPHMTHQIDLELYEQLRSKYQAARRSQRASSLAAAAARTEAEERRARRRRRRGSSSSGDSRGSGSSEGSGSDQGEDSQGGADSLRSAANSVQGNSQAGQGRYSGRGGSTRPSTAGSRPNQGTNKKKKRHMARWSPAAEYYEKDTRKQRLTSELSRITQSMQPAYSMRARTALPQSRDVTPGPNKYDIGRAVTASSR